MSGSDVISAAQYFGPYAEHPALTPEIRFKATAMLDVVNDLYDLAARDGCELPDNPRTGCGVSGSGNGGYRPPECKVGSPTSEHKNGRAVDRYDPHRQFASWCLAHPEELEKRGLHMEDPRWTVTLDEHGKVVGAWVHLQDLPPKSGRRVFIPNTTPALAPYPPKWSRP